MTANVLRITEHPPLRRDQAFERLRDAIIKGHFKPGDRLIERDLCDRRRENTARDKCHSNDPTSSARFRWSDRFVEGTSEFRRAFGPSGLP